MPKQLSFDPGRSAALSMDYQAGIVSIYAKDREGLLPRAASVLKYARNSGMSVIHVRVGFRPNLPAPRRRLSSSAFLDALSSPHL